MYLFQKKTGGARWGCSLNSLAAKPPEEHPELTNRLGFLKTGFKSPPAVTRPSRPRPLRRPSSPPHPEVRPASDSTYRSPLDFLSCILTIYVHVLALAGVHASREENLISMFSY